DAITDATALNSLKLGTNVQQSAQAQRMDKAVGGGGGGRGGWGQASPPTQPTFGYKDVQNYSQQGRGVNGPAVYQNSKTWTDNTVQTKQNLKRQEIKFNSEDYFALMNKYPVAIPWLSLGSEVDVVIEDTLYVVR